MRATSVSAMCPSLAILLLLLVLAPRSSSAANYVYNSGQSGRWQDVTWIPAPPAVGDIVVFNHTTPCMVTVDAASNIPRLGEIRMLSNQTLVIEDDAELEVDNMIIDNATVTIDAGGQVIVAASVSLANTFQLHVYGRLQQDSGTYSTCVAGGGRMWIHPGGLFVYQAGALTACEQFRVMEGGDMLLGGTLDLNGALLEGNLATNASAASPSIIFSSNLTLSNNQTVTLASGAASMAAGPSPTSWPLVIQGDAVLELSSNATLRASRTTIRSGGELRLTGDVWYELNDDVIVAENGTLNSLGGHVLGAVNLTIEQGGLAQFRRFDVNTTAAPVDPKIVGLVIDVRGTLVFQSDDPLVFFQVTSELWIQPAAEMRLQSCRVGVQDLRAFGRVIVGTEETEDPGTTQLRPDNAGIIVFFPSAQVSGYGRVRFMPWSMMTQAGPAVLNGRWSVAEVRTETQIQASNSYSAMDVSASLLTSLGYNTTEMPPLHHVHFHDTAITHRIDSYGTGQYKLYGNSTLTAVLDGPVAPTRAWNNANIMLYDWSVMRFVGTQNNIELGAAAVDAFDNSRIEVASIGAADGSPSSGSIITPMASTLRLYGSSVLDFQEPTVLQPFVWMYDTSTLNIRAVLASARVVRLEGAVSLYDNAQANVVPDDQVLENGVSYEARASMPVMLADNSEFWMRGSECPGTYESMNSCNIDGSLVFWGDVNVSGTGGTSAWIRGIGTIDGEVMFSGPGGGIDAGGTGTMSYRDTGRLIFRRGWNQIDVGCHLIVDVEAPGMYDRYVLSGGFGTMYAGNDPVVRSLPGGNKGGITGQMDIQLMEINTMMMNMPAGVNLTLTASEEACGIDVDGVELEQDRVAIRTTDGNARIMGVAHELNIDVADALNNLWYPASAMAPNGVIYVHGGTANMEAKADGKLYSVDPSTIDHTRRDENGEKHPSIFKHHPAPELPRLGHVMEVDADRNRLLLWGGATFFNFTMANDAMMIISLDDLSLTEHGDDPPAVMSSVPGEGVSLACSVLSNDIMWIIGGADSNYTMSGGVIAFNAAADTWNTTAWPALPTPLLLASAVASEDSLYVFGGYIDRPILVANLRANDQLFRMDISSATWSTLAVASAQRPDGRAGTALNWVPGRTDALVIFGGVGYASVTPYGDTWMYNLTSNQWQPIGCSLGVFGSMSVMVGAWGYHNETWYGVPALGVDLERYDLLIHSCPAGFGPGADVVPGYGSCAECDPGTASMFGLGCDECAPGYFTGISGADQCAACNVGTFTEGPGMTNCTACQVGHYCPNPGQREACAAGKFNPETGKMAEADCLVCPVGTYSPSPGSSSCNPCAVGYANGFTGQASCQPCEAGKYIGTPGASVCISCPAGMFTNTTGNTACDPCPLGTANQIAGQDECIPCVPGTYTNTLGATSCTQCSPGQESPSTGSTGCIDCQPGTYAGNFGRPTCDPCFLGTYSDTEKTVECTSCPIEYYLDQQGQTECKECPENTLARVVGAQFQEECLCKTGYFNREGVAGEACTSCLEGATCAGGLDTPVAMAGYWQSEDDPFTVFKCLDPSACPGGASATCSAGYTGRLCGLCEDGYFRFGRICQQCPAGAPVFIAVYVGVGFGFVALFVFLASAGYEWGSLALAVNFIQLVGVLHKFPVQWDQTLSMLFAVLSISNLNIEMTMPECQGWATPTTYWAKFNFVLTLPLSFAALFLLTYLMYCLVMLIGRAGSSRISDGSKATETSEERPSVPKASVYRRTGDVFIQAYCSFLSFMYIGLVSTSLSAWECVEQVDGSRIFVPDPAITCDTAEHRRFVLVGGIGVLVYAVMMPLCGFFYLRHHRFHLNMPWMKRRMGYLYERYDRRFYYWEVVQSLRKFWFLLCPIVLASPLFTVVFGMVVALLFLLVVTLYKPNLWNVHDRIEVYTLACFMLVLFGGMTAFIGSPDVANVANWATGGLIVTSVVLAAAVAVYDLFIAVVYPEKQAQPGIQLTSNPMSPASTGMMSPPGIPGMVKPAFGATPDVPSTPGSTVTSPTGSSAGRRLSLTSTPVPEQVALLGMYIKMAPDTLIGLTERDRLRFIKEIKRLLGEDNASTGSRSSRLRDALSPKSKTQPMNDGGVDF